MRLRDATAPHGLANLDVQTDWADGAVFEEMGLLDSDEASRIREFQDERNVPFTQAGLELGLLDEDMIEQALSRRQHGSVQAWNNDRGNAPFAAGMEASTPFARELRHLLSNLAKGQSVQRTPQRLVVAGVNTSDEASVVAASLATTCAANGYRTLLVDTNIDQPSVDRYFGVSNSVGLSSLLASSEPPHRFAQSTPVPNLAVICAGPKLPNHSSLLARERLFHRLQPIANSFEYIIADCSAVTPSRMGRISAGADNVIVAVKEHVSSMRELATMIETLQAESSASPSVLMIE